MRFVFLVSAAVLASTSVAQAETYTFAGSSKQGLQVMAPGPGGKPVVGSTAEIETTVTWASGAKEKSTGNCVAWSAPPGSGASVNGVCNSKGTDGATTALFFTCISTNEKNTESDCWGRIEYTSGKSKGKSSTVSWHGKQNADGKGGTAVGAGNMN